MKNLLYLSFVAMVFAGCVHDQPSAAYLDDAGISQSAFKSSKRCAEPVFERVRFGKKLPSSYLQVPRDRYRVGPGDLLEIEVAERQLTQAQTKVMPDGMLYFSLAGGVNVTGKTLSDVARILEQRLADEILEPVVSVNLVTTESQRYWVLGSVRRPGTYPLTHPTRLIEALSNCEGLNVETYGEEEEETADLHRAIFVRNGRLVPVDFKALVEDGDMSQNIYVKANDYIYLPSIEKTAVYVLGQVNNPGPVFFDHQPSLLTAVAAAGGPISGAIVNKALILRGGNCLETEVAVVNLEKVMKGHSPNLRVAPGDVIWVPKTLWNNLRDYTETALTGAAQAIAVQEGFGAFGIRGETGVTISAP